MILQEIENSKEIFTDKRRKLNEQEAQTYAEWRREFLQNMNT